MLRVFLGKGRHSAGAERPARRPKAAPLRSAQSVFARYALPENSEPPAPTVPFGYWQGAGEAVGGEIE